MTMTEDPVTVVVRRRVRSGREQAYEASLDRLTTAARALPGYRGAEVHRSRLGGRGYASVLHFATLADLEAFDGTDLRAWTLAEAAPLVEGDAVWDRLTGLELWFAPPDSTRAPQPSPHRMALVLIVVVTGLGLGLGLALGPVIAEWPLPLRVLVVITLQIVPMTYVILPRMTRLLARFIYPSSLPT